MKRSSALLFVAIGAVALGLAAERLLRVPGDRDLEYVVAAASSSDASASSELVLPENQTTSFGRQAASMPVDATRSSGSASARGNLALDARRRLEGRVLGLDDKPIGDATVFLWPDQVQTSGDGRFQIDLPTWLSSEARLFAVKSGLQPASLDIADRIARGDTAPIELHIGPESLEISGVVLQSNGELAQGWNVELTDGTEISDGLMPPLLLEGVCARTTAKAMPLETNERGEFTLRGLSRRSYGLRALKSSLSGCAKVDAVMAGSTGVVLRAEANRAEVSGTVVDRRGAPVNQVTIDVQLRVLKGRNSASWSACGSSESSGDGEVVLENVPWRDGRLIISGPRVVRCVLDLDELRLSNGFRITVDLSCDVKLACEPSRSAPTRGIALDERGTVLSEIQIGEPREAHPFMISTDSDASTPEGFATPAPQSEMLALFTVSEVARTLVLFHNDTELVRLPLELTPGKVTEVRY